MSNSSKIDRSAVFQAILGELPEVKDSSETSEPNPSMTSLAVSSNYLDIPLNVIDFNTDQPRTDFNHDALVDLAKSIQDHGVIEPIIVRPVGSRYQVVAGERRTRAAKIAGLSEVPARVMELSVDQAFEISVIENLQREDLNPVEETEAIVQLIALLSETSTPNAISLLQDVYNRERGRRMGVASEEQATLIQEVFQRLGRFTVSSFVTNRIPILAFPQQLKDAVRAGQLEFTKAQLLARVEDEEARSALVELSIKERLSISQIRRRIADLSQPPKNPSASKSGIFTTTEQAPMLMREVKRRLNMQTVTQMDGDLQAQIAQLLARLNQLLGD